MQSEGFSLVDATSEKQNSCEGREKIVNVSLKIREELCLWPRVSSETNAEHFEGPGMLGCDTLVTGAVEK